MKILIMLLLVLLFNSANAISNTGPRFYYSWSIVDKCSSRMIDMLKKNEIKKIYYCEVFIDSFKDIHTFRILREEDKVKYRIMKKVNDMYKKIIEE